MVYSRIRKGVMVMTTMEFERVIQRKRLELTDAERAILQKTFGVDHDPKQIPENEVERRILFEAASRIWNGRNSNRGQSSQSNGNCAKE